MTSLHDELAGATVGRSCRLCAFLDSMPPDVRRAWQTELALPVTIVGHTSVLNALRKRGVSVSDASVRRHRSNHR
jgi:hypothetical protein